MATATSETVKTLSLEALLQFAQDNREKVFDVNDPCGCLAATLADCSMADHVSFCQHGRYDVVDDRFGYLTSSLKWTGFNESDSAWVKNYTGGQLAYGILLLIDGVHPHDAAERVAAYAAESAPVPA